MLALPWDWAVLPPAWGVAQSLPGCWGKVTLAQIRQCQKVRHTNTGRSRQGSLLLQKGAGAPKSVRAEESTLPYFSLTQVMDLSPSHWSGQDVHIPGWLI